MLTICAQYKSSKAAVSVYHTINTIRYYVASAFMTVYPDVFPASRIINWYELSGKAVIWETFRKHLSSSFRSYHKPIKRAATRNYDLYQVRSRFEDHSNLDNIEDSDGEFDDIRGSPRLDILHYD